MTVRDSLLGLLEGANREIRWRGSLYALLFRMVDLVSGVANVQAIEENLRVQFFGTGEDGDVTINAPIKLTRDMYYRNLTLEAGCEIRPNGWRIFVSEELDLSNAPANAILAQSTSPNGGNGAILGGGGASAAITSGSTIGTGTAGTTGGNGAAANGAAAAAAAAGNAGGMPGTPGAGGNGSAGVGGAATVPTQLFFAIYRLAVDLRRQGVVIGGGGGPGGGGGGGNGANTGGGGGGGGAGGYVAQIYARNIRRGPGTAPGAINCSGGNGGNGASPVAANVGGGGGGGGGAGGWCVILVENLLGSVAPGAILSNGGNGGNGGNGNGTGIGGAGGGGGGSGRFTLWDWTSASFVDQFNSTPSAGGAPAGTVGGAGGAGEARSFDL